MIYASNDKQWKVTEETISENLHDLWGSVKKGIRKSGSLSCLCGADQPGTSQNSKYLKGIYESRLEVDKLNGCSSPGREIEMSTLIKRNRSTPSLSSFTSAAEN
ncbi:hypothetical protein R1flu_014125 [Riccia fluitans]|uniref:Uncharacterized protein n=1 Tax=Riccia fluitans TaxID=41844 RepID=A0ABD1YIN3_9MARC